MTVLWDDNHITIDGSTDLSTSEDVRARYAATGWHVVNCNGHDTADIERALDEALADPRPSLVACKTVIGKGAPNKQGTSATHGAALGEAEVAAARETLGWTSPAFEIPADIYADWNATGRRGKAVRAEWQDRLKAHDRAAEFTARMAGELPGLHDWADYKAKVAADAPKMATRKSSEAALAVLTQDVPALIGGSADLTGSNNTKTPSTGPLTAENYAGRYVYYGIREFGMGAAMNGMALHGGVIPFGGTFLVFADYCRPAIRLSALQQIRVVYVMTHDSIGLGEDGPTHQPIEHLQSLRAIPGLLVMRPADTLETAECWELALKEANRPSLLALTRQNLPAVRHDASENLCARGAYRLRAAKAERQVVLIATGSEVELALNVAEALEAQKIGADVVSMPCTELFDEQSDDYRAQILPNGVLRVSIEAGTTFGWERYTGTDGLRIGLDRFGASAPAEELFEKFGFSVDAIVPKVLAKLGK
jgi:transketolase